MACNELVLESNSFGVRLFELGLLVEARTHFQHALDVLPQVRESPKLEPCPDGDSPRQSLPHPGNHPIQGWTCSMGHDQDDDDDVKDHLFVYSRAIQLAPTFQFQHVHIYRTTIAFNLALTHHLIAILTQTSSDYQKASVLYEESMSALGQVFEASSVFDDDPYLNDLRVVILNNAGHIYYTDMANVMVAAQCFQTVCGIISDSVRIGPATALRQGEIHRMVANVLVQYIYAAPVA